MNHDAKEPDLRSSSFIDSRSGLLPTTQRALLYRLATGQADGRLPSLAAGVMRDGAQAWFAARGTVDGAAPTADTQYRIGSMTKMFVALAVMRLRDEGHLRLGELLAHTAGLASDSAGPWWERSPGELRPETSDVLGSNALRHPPGRRFHYSNVGFAMLGALVSKVRGKRWNEVIRDEILNPLEMSRTSVTPQPPHATGWAVHPWADLLLPEPFFDAGLMAPAGQFWSTTEDLCRFAAFLGNGASEVLSSESLEEMREPAAPGACGERAVGYGLGLQLMWSGDRMFYGHCGSVPGFISGLWVSDDGVGAIALANATSEYTVGSVASDLIAIIQEHEPAIPPEWRALSEVDSTALSLAGTWYWGPVPQILQIHANNELSLTSLSSDEVPARFRPTAEGTWTGVNGYHADETLHVVTRPDGTISHLDLGTLIFTREPYDDSAPIPGGVDSAGWRSG